MGFLPLYMMLLYTKSNAKEKSRSIPGQYFYWDRHLRKLYTFSKMIDIETDEVKVQKTI